MFEVDHGSAGSNVTGLMSSVEDGPERRRKERNDLGKRRDVGLILNTRTLRITTIFLMVFDLPNFGVREC